MDVIGIHGGFPPTHAGTSVFRPYVLTVGLLVGLMASEGFAQQELQRAGRNPSAELSAEALASSNAEISNLNQLSEALERRQRDLEIIDEEIARIEEFIAGYEPQVETIWLPNTDLVALDFGNGGDGGGGGGGGGDGGGGGGGGGDDGGGGDCFCSGTLVTMADGYEKEIESIRVGEQVLGRSGSVNTVLDTPTFPVGQRTLYLINQKLRLTPEHPLLTDQGWKSLDPESTRRVNPDTPVTRLEVGDRLMTLHGQEPVKSIAILSGYDEDVVYSLLVSGDGTYIAEGYVVHHNFRTDATARVSARAVQAGIGER